MEEKLTLFKNRKRFGIEKNIDIIFKNTALVLSSFVAIILLGIILVVFFQSFESFSRYGLKFLVTSEWNPVKDEYGAFTAIYGTLVTSFLSLLITIPLGVGTAIFITEDFVPKAFREIIEKSLIMLSPIIPHVCHELWEKLGKKYPIHNETWPAFDSDRLEGNEMTIAIQINGKLRGKILVETSTSEEKIIEESKELENIKKYLEKENIKKTIYVPKKLVNFVV